MRFAILSIDHIVLRVRSVETMIAFYRDVLFCPVERLAENIGLYQLRAGSSLIDLVDVTGELGRAGGAPPGREGHNLDHVCLRIAPFNAEMLHRHLEGHGVEIVESGQRYGADGTGPSIYVRDPEGNLVELKGPPVTPPGA
jgi:glyoxylase I family protein